jgi:hypothetical protein
MARFAEDVVAEDHARAAAPKTESHSHADTLKSAASGIPGVDSGIARIAEHGSRASLAPSAVLRLQRSVGNAGTTAYLQRDDIEQERQAAPSERRSPVHDTIGSGGAPLDRETRSQMEGHLGTDLSDVRLHVDRHSAESVQAAAYTVGNDVVVHPDHYQAGTPSAQRTLVHELTHVVQQRSGPVAGTERAGGIKVSDPHDSFERAAEGSADKFMSSVQTQQLATASGGATGIASVQREAEEHEQEGESVQALSLQRVGAEEEEQEVESVQALSLQREGAEEEEQEGESVQALSLQREGAEEEESDSEG